MQTSAKRVLPFVLYKYTGTNVGHASNETTVRVRRDQCRPDFLAALRASDAPQQLGVLPETIEINADGFSEPEA